jgi:hypothetical protein
MQMGIGGGKPDAAVVADESSGSFDRLRDLRMTLLFSP